MSDIPTDFPMENVSDEADVPEPEVPVFPGDTVPETESTPTLDKEGKPKRAKRTRKREDASEILGMAWGGAGKGLEKADLKGIKWGSYPTGRTMQVQSLVAGNYLDSVVRDTWLDRLLIQPLVRASNTAEGLGALVALPAMIYAIDKKPTLVPAVEPFLRAAFYQTLEDIEPAIKKAEAAQEKRIKALQRTSAMFGDEGTDPFEGFMNYIMAPPGGAPVADEPIPEPVPTDEPNVTVIRPKRTTRPRHPTGGVS